MGNCCRGTGFVDPKEGVAQLPQDFITEILVRLPVKSLFRFRCVSKSFCTIIDSQYFINSHLNRSAEDRSQLKLIFPHGQLFSTNYNSAKLQVYISCGWSAVYGVFLYPNGQSIAGLWNPSTHQLRILPRLFSERCMFDYPGMLMGLGYDSSKDDYKVVAVEPLPSVDPKVIVEYRVWILELRSNSWRRVCIDFCARADVDCYGSRFGYFSHGNLHWLFGKEPNRQQLVAFDLAKETFSILPKPSYNPVRRTKSNLNVLDESLCMGFCNCDIEGEAVLYVRKKDGEEFMWNLLYSVTMNQLPRFLKMKNFDRIGVLGYSKEGDKIMLDLGLECVVSYDIEAKDFQPTEITTNANRYFDRPLSLVESLVPLHGRPNIGGLIYHKFSKVLY